MLADDTPESSDSDLELSLAGLNDHNAGWETKVIRAFFFNVEVLPLLDLDVVAAVINGWFLASDTSV